MNPEAFLAVVRRPAALLLGLLFCVPVPSSADTVPYRHFTARDGLPHETVFSLDQGPDGRLWIGTAGGLAIYDGHNIRRVRLPDSLGTPKVLDILARSPNQAWAILQGEGLVRLRHRRVEQVIPTPVGTNGFMHLLSRGDTLLAVMRKSLWTFSEEGKRLTKHGYDYPIQTGAPETIAPSVGLGVTDASLAPDGTIWVLDERHGLGRLSLDGSVTFLNENSRSTENEEWTSARVIQPQTALVTGKSGTYRVDLSSGRQPPLSLPPFSELREFEAGFTGIRHERVVQQTSSGTVTYGPRLGLPRTLYKTAFEDESGGLWIGTGDGLLYLPAPRARHVTQIDGTTLRWQGTFGVDSTRNELWVASWGRGLFRLRPTPAHQAPGTSLKWTMSVDGGDGVLHALSREGWYRRDPEGWSLVNASLSSIEGVVRANGTGYFWTNEGLVRLRPHRTAACGPLGRARGRGRRGPCDRTTAGSRPEESLRVGLASREAGEPDRHRRFQWIRPFGRSLRPPERRP